MKTINNEAKSNTIPQNKLSPDQLVNLELLTLNVSKNKYVAKPNMLEPKVKQYKLVAADK